MSHVKFVIRNEKASFFPLLFLWQTIVLPNIDHLAADRSSPAWDKCMNAVFYSIRYSSIQYARADTDGSFSQSDAIVWIWNRGGERANTAESSDENSITETITLVLVYSRLMPVLFNSHNEAKSRGLLFHWTYYYRCNYHCTLARIPFRWATRNCCRLLTVLDDLELNL